MPEVSLNYALVGAASYAVAVAAFGVLSALLLAGAGRRGIGRVLLLACALSWVWAVVLGGVSYLGLPISSLWVSLMELARLGGWLLFMIVLLQVAMADGGRPGSPWLLLGGGSFLAGALGLALSAAPVGFAPRLGFVLLTLALLGGMVLVEQFYRRLPAASRWSLKHLCVGLGLLFAFDFYVQAHATLTGALSPAEWYARGLVNALAVPLLAVSAARNPAWEVEIGVSRRVVTDSLVVTGAGGFLVLMGVAGYYVREFGGSWGNVLQFTLLAGAAAGLALAVSSTTLRARARVFVSKHFFSYKYDYREEWLRFIATLSDPRSRESLRVRALRSLAQIVDCPRGGLWAVNDNGHFVLAATLNATANATLTVPAHSPLAAFLRRTGWVVDRDELAVDPDRYEGLELPRWPAPFDDYWLLVPLLEHEHLEGFVVLSRPLAPRTLNWEDRDLLKTAGRQVAGYVALVKATEALADRRQFAAFQRLSAFVVHDLNNVQGQLALITANAQRHRDNPEFIDDALNTVARASARLGGVLGHLRDSAPAADLAGTRREPVDVAPMLRRVVEAAGGRRPAPRLALGPDPLPPLRLDGERLATMLEHLVRNAQEATPADGEVVLSGHLGSAELVIELTDSGCGMEEAFLQERLFRPFDTSKGNAGMGVGVYEVRQFVESAGGILDVSSRPGAGTTFRLRFALEERGLNADRDSG